MGGLFEGSAWLCRGSRGFCGILRGSAAFSGGSGQRAPNRAPNPQPNLHSPEDQNLTPTLRTPICHIVPISRIYTPTPKPQNSLVRIFLSATRSRMEILTEENLVGQKRLPLQFPRLPFPYTKENQVSLVRTFLSDPGSGNKIRRLGGWGWKNDPEARFE